MGASAVTPCLTVSHVCIVTPCRTPCRTPSRTSCPVSHRARAKPARAEGGWEREKKRGIEREREVRGVWGQDGAEEKARRNGTFDRARRHIDSTHLIATEKGLSCLCVCVFMPRSLVQPSAQHSESLVEPRASSAQDATQTQGHEPQDTQLSPVMVVCVPKKKNCCNPLAQPSSQHLSTLHRPWARRVYLGDTATLDRHCRGHTMRLR